MIARFLLVGAAVAALASASPLTITFSGVADGVLGTNSFTQANFTLTFNSDTTDVTNPSAEPVDWSTPSATPGSFVIVVPSGPTYTGTFTGDQAVFDHPSPNNDIGIWHYNGDDVIAKQEAAFASYNLMSSLGPINDGNNAWPDVSNGMGLSTSQGELTLSNITSMSFQAVVTAGPSGPTGSTGSPGPIGGDVSTPEPSSAMMLSLGAGAIAIGLFRKRTKQS